ncbi:hypothetical protein niasHS_001860 [Heterodera schachtii]|uniref:Homeobox domain-containing protein n=1 Tax=Heterodera schachtii TaxID=97005 RepID=A0ABD2KAZ9_HETSC
MGRQAKKERKKKSMDAIQLISANELEMTKKQNVSPEQLDILKGAFEKRKYPDIFMLEELGRETGITVDQIKAWFQKRRAKHRQKMRKQNTAVTGAKVLYLVRPTDCPPNGAADSLSRMPLTLLLSVALRSVPFVAVPSAVVCFGVPSLFRRQIGQKSAFSKMRIGQQSQKRQK